MHAKLVTGLVSSRDEAERAIQRLGRCGYAREDVSLIMSDQNDDETFSLDSSSRAATGARLGAAFGAVGAMLAAISAVGTSVVIPGIGLVVAGPVAALLAGAGAGGATGGLIGALIGAGIPEYRAELYESGLRDGGILVGVYADSDVEAEMVESVLETVGAEDIRATTGGRPHVESFI